ncbi:MAG: metallophosphoesterase [Lachnospiraceae bacterium]|nr:metallophosphoesterase [Lachnospiraceae bacterium]
MRIGILSDTHGVLPEYFENELKNCDYIIHAGDIGTERCYQQLKALSVPLYMIRGNCDHGRWAAYLPESLAFHIDGLRFYLVHNINDLPYRLEDTDIVITGHTHVYQTYDYRNICYINPGSAGKSRGASGHSMAILEWEASSPASYDPQTVRKNPRPHYKISKRTPAE